MVKAKRKLKYEQGDEHVWEKNKNKILRMKGEKYKGLKRNNEGKYNFSESKSARQMGQRCNSAFCKKNSNKRKCYFIEDKDRELLFTSFWKDMSWGERRTYVASLCHLIQPKVNKTGTNSSRRSGTIEYFLKQNNELLQVCKKMFLQTLGLNEWSVRNWVSNSAFGTGIIISPDHEKRTKKVGRSSNKNKELNNFFDNLPKLPSHYCRSSTNKLYLESFFETKIALYNAYVASLQNSEVVVVNKTDFNKEFQRRNLALYSPKKDMCDLCEGYKYGHITPEIYNLHQKNKIDSRDAKKLDKQVAMNL